ncbi:MAG: hypothetical protein UY72_C0011G0012 [Candidatus Uhrbacteria bacterium GW2011_GWD2_52_7]|uniref:Uncharacterized protein n=1 Tax=Candidatus Uhrbacteria bacterium GW2011_GWD2_52_7 TaxID=1618989 RepID=A0A0G1XHV6_9BACT|nr:MAG: hypothetical protein UY72_C0011G0012 [Candidatus Uhrbacteria bacterium GW2011_GWD2_52_7]
MKKKVVIAGSASLQPAIEKWMMYWNGREDALVTNYPKPIDQSRFLELYPGVHKEFFISLNDADILFIANEEKNGIEGYIGAETFAEIVYALALNLTQGKSIEVILAKQPSERIQASHEIQLWLQLGWLTIFQV